MRDHGTLRGALRGTPVARLARGAYEGAELLGGEAIGRLPGARLRTGLARHVLRMHIEDDVRLYRWREIRGGSQISIGPRSIVGLWATLDGRCGITIGEDVNISSEVALWTMQHDPQSPLFEAEGAPIRIENRAWLSFRSVVLPGVLIGEGAVVAAGAVVTRDVAPYTIVGGVPAVPIGERSRDLRYRFTSRGTPWLA